MPASPQTYNETAVEGTTPKWQLVLKDHDGTALASTDLSTLTLTYLDHTGTAINSRSAQNVLNANDCTIDASGNFLWNVRTADTAIVGTPVVGQSEKHKATLIWTWTDAATVVQTGKAILNLSIINQ